MRGDPELNRKCREALDEFMLAVREGFTGSLTVEFKSGVPQLSRQTKVNRFGR